jgi:hypothetical protein
MASTIKVTDIAYPGSANTAITINSNDSVGIVGGNLSPYTGFRNRIINGGMTIDQRNAGAAITVNSNTGTQFVVDRFIVQGTASAGVFTAQQLSATPPSGFKNYARFTVTTADAAPASGALYTVAQVIEGNNMADLGFGAAGADTVTLSFRVRSSLTGTFSASLKNGTSFNRSYPFQFTISAANTWTNVSVAVSGDITGTWSTGNTGGLVVTVDLGCGSSLLGTANTWQGANYNGVTGSTRLISTLNATLDVTGVQLEKGSTATPFEFRSIGQELALCQRYYEVGAIFPIGFTSSGGNFGSTVKFSATKRASPTLVQTSTSAVNLSATPSNTSTGNAVESFASFRTGGTGAACQYSETWTASAEL